MRVLIAGGGIGGLTAAIALRKHGINALVLEQASELGEIGAGVQIASNAALVLRELGLEAAVQAVGVKPLSYDYRELRSDQLVFQVPLGTSAEERYGAPMYNVHRADLIDLLRAALPEAAVRLGARCETISQSASGVTVTLAGGEKIEGDVLIGCDGIHSAVRRAMRGDEEKHDARILMWRSLIPAEKLEGLGLEERGNYWFGPGRTLITYWVRPKKLYSILASVPASEVTRESWSDSGDIDEMLASFSDACPRVLQMLRQCETSFITGMYYRDPIDVWTEGRIALLGDAAHPMVPFLAAGAGQAIEDAWVLARCLSRSAGDVEAALREYQTRRQPRTTRIQSGARAVVKLMHETDGLRIRNRNERWKGMARIDPLGETSWGLAWDYNVISASEQPPGEVLNLTGLKEGKALKRPEAQRAFNMWKFAFTPEDVARGHDGLREGYDRFLTTNFPLPAHARAETCELGDVKAWKVSPETAGGGRTILHFHGGGYLIGSAHGSLEYAYRLANTVGGTCYTVDYRLAPEHPYPAAIDDAMAAYRALLRTGVDPATIFLSGESAGGGLAMALALALKTAGDPMPGGIIAAAPFLDLTLSGPSVRKFSQEDPAANRDTLTFMGASYFQAHEPTDPMVSPLYGDLSGLPPVYITASEGEALVDDAKRFVEKARRQGVSVTARIIEDSVHVYPIFPFLPETAAMLGEVAEWVGQVTAAHGNASVSASRVA